MEFPHIIEAQQFSREWIGDFFPLAKAMKGVVKLGGSEDLRGKRMFSVFYEPSTRTRVSFESAMTILGGSVASSTENAAQFSSAAKGESLEDSIRVYSAYYPDVIVLRHNEEGGAERAAQVSMNPLGQIIPVINAGDGTGQHPTQALLDLFTIHQELGQIDGTSIALMGDLERGRTIHSLAYLLGKFADVRIFAVSPPALRMPSNITDYLVRHGVQFSEHQDVREIAGDIQVLYQTRTQRERGSLDEASDSNSHCKVDREVLDLMQSDAIVMHPLPRNEEIDPAIDSDPRAAYFRQVEYGLYVRIALLHRLLKA